MSHSFHGGHAHSEMVCSRASEFHSIQKQRGRFSFTFPAAVAKLPTNPLCYPNPGGCPVVQLSGRRTFSDICLFTTQQMPVVWVTARAFADIFPLVELDRNTADYPILIKAAGMPTVEQIVFTAPEMLFSSSNERGETGMLANDGTDGHLGPHLLLVGCERHRSVPLRQSPLTPIPENMVSLQKHQQ